MSEFYFQDNSDIENTKLEMAKALYSKGDYQAALNLYSDMIKTNYSHKLCHHIGCCYYKLDDFKNAETYLKDSIRLEPRKSPSYNFLANLYSKNNMPEKAIENWSYAHSYFPDDENICLNLATSYFLKDMKFQAHFYYQKYLKYAKDKASPMYSDILTGTQRLQQIGADFYKKAKQAKNLYDTETAIQALEYAVTNNPYNFDINYELADAYFQKCDYKNACTYFKQAYFIDTKSLDTLQKISVATLELKDFYNAYISVKRTIPHAIGRQQKYLEIVQTLRDLETKITSEEKESHLNIAKSYYNESNYHSALFEYQNYLLVTDSTENDEILAIVERLKNFLNPEESIIRACLEEGGVFYTNGDYKRSNKFFKRIMVLANTDSAEYKMAKARVKDV